MGARDTVIEEYTAQLQACMYQYSRAIYRSIKDLIEVKEGVAAACAFIEEQIEAGALDGGVARCRATTRKGKPCQRTPLPDRDYCPSHQHLERSKVAA